MSRQARVKSPTNVYHVMLRGINKQLIFWDEEDYRQFKRLLARYKGICGYELYAYCLMDNHIHLLLRTGDEPLDKVFRRIGSSFVYWYNTKYERTGHLFQDRYRSEIINSDPDFFKTLKYILYNPVKAGICQSPQDYPHSSGREYIRSERGITDKDLVYSFIDPDALKKYIFQEEKNEDECMEYRTSFPKRLTDQAAKKLILREFGTCTPTVKKYNEREEMNESIRKLRAQGVSIRQMSRLTGISKKIIEKA